MSIEERIEDTCHLVVVGLIAAAFLPWEEAPLWEYWTTLGPIAWLAGSVLAIVLSVLEIGMKDWPRLGRFCLTAAVVAVLFLGAWNEAEQAQGAAEIKKGLATLRSDTTGQNNYAYLHSREGQKRDEQFLLDLQAFGSRDRIKIGFHSIDADGKKGPAITWVEIDIEGENVNFGQLPTGRWHIDFKGAHTKWGQVLVLDEAFNVLEEVIEVYREGETECLFCRKKLYPIKVEK